MFLSESHTISHVYLAIVKKFYSPAMFRSHDLSLHTPSGVPWWIESHVTCCGGQVSSIQWQHDPWPFPCDLWPWLDEEVQGHWPGNIEASCLSLAITWGHLVAMATVTISGRTRVCYAILSCLPLHPRCIWPGGRLTEVALGQDIPVLHDLCHPRSKWALVTSHM